MSGSRIRTPKPERNAPASAARETRRRRLDFIPGTNLDEYAAPWIGLILIVIIGWQLRTHLFTSWWVRIVAGTLAFLCSVVVTFFVSEYARPRNEFLRLHAVGTTLIVGGMLSVSIWAGLARAWLYSLIFLLPTLALTWNVRQIRIIRGEGKDTHDVRNSWIEALGTDGTKVVDVKRDDRTVRLKVRGLHGKSAKDVAALVPGLNAITGLHPGAVRAIESPHRADEADIILNLEDSLNVDSGRPAWDGVRRSIADGIPLGVYEDGEIVTLVLLGSKSFAPSQLQVMGMSRSGKSHLFRIFVWGLSETFDAVLWVSDTIKGAQTLSPVMPAISRYENTREGTRVMLDDVERIIRYRSEALGKLYLDEWQPGCGMPALFVWVEEAARVLGGNERWTRLAESSLSTGIIMVDSMQRTDHRNKSTSARSQVASSLCFGVNDPEDSAMVLSERVQAVSQAHNWKTRHQGRFHADIVSADYEHQIMPARTFWHDDIIAELRDAISANASRMGQLDAGSLAVCARKEEVIPMPVPDQRKPIAPSAVRPSSVGPDGMTDADVDDVDPDGRPEPLSPDEQTERAEADGEIGPPSAVPWALPNPDAGTDGPTLSSSERHATFVRTVADLASRATERTSNGHPVVQISDVHDALARVPGWRPSMRPWTATRMTMMCETGAAERLRRGRYAIHIVPTPDVVPDAESEPEPPSLFG